MLGQCYKRGHSAELLFAKPKLLIESQYFENSNNVDTFLLFNEYEIWNLNFFRCTDKFEEKSPIY